MAEYIITDFGYSPQLTNTETNEILTLDRYGVWICSGGVAKEVKETSNDVEYLKSKYKTDVVIPISQKAEINSRLKKNVEG
ncbi:MAG: hypothetical protein N3A68_09505 [Bacteroidia bacterium]|nr:hypothetical protein [Bacteroidia bacterium]